MTLANLTTLTSWEKNDPRDSGFAPISKARGRYERCADVGFSADEEGLGFFDMTSDTGANMVNSFEYTGGGGGDCATHAVELSAKKFYEHKGICDMKKKV